MNIIRLFKRIAKKVILQICKKYEIFTPIDFPESVRIQSPDETLNTCRKIIESKTKGAYLRFGDGEVSQLHGGRNGWQVANLDLSKEMKECFLLEGPGIIKSLMIHSEKYGLMPGMKPGIHEMSNKSADDLLQKCFEYFIGYKIYSHAALSYESVYDKEFTIDFLKFLKTTNPILVGNEKIPQNIVEKLFGKTFHIKTPIRDCYTEIDRIEKETIQAIEHRGKDFDVLVLAMGSPSNALQKRILKKGYNVFLFDFGSLFDALCDFKTRAWIELVNLPQDYWSSMLEEVAKA